MKKIAPISGAIFTSTFIIGKLFKIMHWIGGNALISIGMNGLALVFVPLYAQYKYQSSKKLKE